MNVASHKVRPPLHTIERVLVALFAAHLCFLPWAFGTMHAWSQLVSLGMSAVSIVVALWPRHYDEEQAGGQPFTMQTWPRLLRFPLFWLGLLLLGYLGLQSANPAWVWTHNATQWWMQAVPHADWLPSGTVTPFERFSLWRQFIIYASAWMTVCALWIGITRRRSLQILLGVLVGNGLLLVIEGFIHRMGGDPRVLWIRTFKDADSFSSFVYRNHGAGYFGLVGAAAFGLMLWHFFEGRRRMARSTPAALWLLAAVLIVFGVLFSYSRGGVISLAVFLVAALVATVILRASSPVPSTMPRAVGASLTILVILVVGYTVNEADFSGLTRRFAEFARLGFQDESYLSRELVRERATQMLGDHWVWGTGSGSFRYLFPIYISDSHYLYENGRAFWEHAHIDWLEIPIELGLPGTLLIAAAFGWCLLRWFRLGGWRHPVAVMLMLGCLQTLLHAVVDFPFQCPAILLTWWVLLTIALRWLEFDEAAAGN